MSSDEFDALLPGVFPRQDIAPERLERLIGSTLRAARASAQVPAGDVPGGHMTLGNTPYARMPGGTRRVLPRWPLAGAMLAASVLGAIAGTYLEPARAARHIAQMFSSTAFLSAGL